MSNKWKERVWKCNCCNMWHRRYKEQNDIPKCTTCNQDMIQGNKIPNMKNCKHNRQITKENNLRNKLKLQAIKYWSKLRNGCGEELRISKETKNLWKPISRIKTRSALIRYAQKWIENLGKDIDNAKNPENWAKNFDIYSKNPSISRSRGGFAAPKIQLVDEEMYSHGTYKSGLLIGGSFIELNKNHNITEMKKTLLHEALHYIDSRSNIHRANHDCYFKIRLHQLGRKFKIKGVDVSDLN